MAFSYVFQIDSRPGNSTSYRPLDRLGRSRPMVARLISRLARRQLSSATAVQRSAPRRQFGQLSTPTAQELGRHRLAVARVQRPTDLALDGQGLVNCLIELSSGSSSFRKPTRSRRDHHIVEEGSMPTLAIDRTTQPKPPNPPTTIPSGCHLWLQMVPPPFAAAAGRCGPRATRRRT